MDARSSADSHSTLMSRSSGGSYNPVPKMDLAQIYSPPMIPSSPSRRAAAKPVKPNGAIAFPSGRTKSSTPSKSASTGLDIRKQVTCGMVASAIAEIIIFPLDTIKLLQQIHGRGSYELVKDILQAQGVGGFYRGLFSRLVQTLLSNGVFFFFQTLFKNKFQKSGNSMSRSLILNMVAQQMNRLLTTPFEVVANVNQSDPTATGFISTFLKIWRTDGLHSFWKGLGVSLILSSNPAFMFTLVDRLTAMLLRFKGRRNSHPQDIVSAGEMFFVSGTAKMVATFLTYPLIRTKVLMQTAKGASIGLLPTLKKTFQDEGLRGLYVGVWTLSWKTVIFNALMMAIKQKILAVITRPIKPDATELPMNPQDPGSSPFRRQLECLGDALPYDIKGKVVYIDGAWSYLHPSHQHMLAEAQNYGDYLIVGVHDETTRLKHGHSGGALERYDNRLARIRLVRGVDAMLHEAPWIVSAELLRDLNVSVVVSGYPNTVFSNTVDPYAVPKQLGIYSSLADPYSGFWRHMVHVMFSNVDAADGHEDVFPFRGSNDFHHPMFHSNSTGNFTIRRCNSFYFYHDSKDTTTYPSPYSRRGRHLAKAQKRRDRNTGSMEDLMRAKKAGAQTVLVQKSPSPPVVRQLGNDSDSDDDEFNSFELPAPAERLSIGTTLSMTRKCVVSPSAATGVRSSLYTDKSSGSPAGQGEDASRGKARKRRKGDS